MRRIVVLGTSGSGKTTLARELSARLDIPHVELDALHWRPNWVEASDEEMRSGIERSVAGDGWVVDGNYLKRRDQIWPRADTLICLDYPMTVVFTRCFARTLRRWWNREVLWAGNRETLFKQFFTNDSILLWVIQSWRRHRRDYPKLLRSEQCRHLRILRFRTPDAVERWKRSIKPVDSRST